MTKHDDPFPFRHILRLIAVAAVVVLGACGGGVTTKGAAAPEAAGDGSTSNSTEDSTTETAAADTSDVSGDPCRLLTAEEAKAALGVAVAPAVKTEHPDSGYGPGADCRYHSVDEPAGPASVHVGILGDEYPRALWEQAQQAEGFAAVSGVGELAYFDGDNKLEVFDQGRWIQVQMVNPQLNEIDQLVPLLSDMARNAVQRV